MERFPWQKAVGLLLFLLFFSVLLENMTRNQRVPDQAVAYSVFKQELRQGNVQSVTVTEDEISGTFFREVAGNWRL